MIFLFVQERAQLQAIADNQKAKGSAKLGPTLKSARAIRRLWRAWTTSAAVRAVGASRLSTSTITRAAQIWLLSHQACPANCYRKSALRHATHAAAAEMKTWAPVTAKIMMNGMTTLAIHVMILRQDSSCTIRALAQKHFLLAQFRVKPAVTAALATIAVISTHSLQMAARPLVKNSPTK
jgi:hypothetical protein